MADKEAMTIACEPIGSDAALREVAIGKHELEMPDLMLEEVLYPWGFPLMVKTNSREVLRQCRELWGKFRLRRNRPPICAEVWALESDAAECPPAPTYRLMSGVWMTIADADNYCVLNLDSCKSRVVITRTALNYPLYAQYFLLGMMACCVTVRFTTPIHAACVASHGKGVLLCGESGAGKSTLSYACARAGWTYVSDDATLLAQEDDSRQVIGNCHQIRFRPGAAKLFPELRDLEITPRAAGKPSIEVPTASMRKIHCAETVPAEFVVFLNRNWSGPPEIVPYSKDAARASMRKALFSSGKVRLAQHEAIKRLLEGEVLELRYTSLDAAVERLRELVMEGK